jgi:hypothetical protein
MASLHETLAPMDPANEEWRVEVDLDDPGHGFRLGERLRSLDLDDEARQRLGDRVIVTRDGSAMFMYAGSEQGAREAERVARQLLSAEGLTARISVTRWHADEDAWKDASVPLPETNEEHAIEHARGEAAAEREPPSAWEYHWEVRVDLPSLRDTLDFGGRLEDEGIDVKRRFKYLLVGAASEERADELADRIRSEAPAGSSVHVGVSGATHPVFVFLGAHTPGIARDLGA